MNTYPIRPATDLDLSRRRSVYGVGVNDAPYLTTTRDDSGKKIECPFYKTWRSMLMRAYSTNYSDKHPTYRGVSVCKTWRVFMVFRNWMEVQDWESKSLDKDIISPGNKVYCPSHCAFVTHRTNTVLHENSERRGAWPLGVSYTKGKGAFRARHGRKELGQYATPDAAHSAWLLCKAGVLTELAATQSDARVRDALLVRANLLIKDVL